MPIINEIKFQNSAWWLQNKGSIEQSHWPEVTKACGAVAATFFHQQLLQRRFQPGNRERFHLQPRKPGYELQKLKMAAKGYVREGGTVDLVKFGRLRKMLAEFGAVSATAKQASLTMVGPPYTRIRRAGSPDKALEILLMIDAETSEVQQQQQETMLEQMNAPQPTENETL